MQTFASNLPNPDEKGFTLIRTDAIQLAVWLEGYTPLDDQPLKSLSEDISYRIRETLDSAVNYMRHCKRSKLKTSDLNKAFQFCNIEKTYGYLNKEPFEYNIIQGVETKDKSMQNCLKTCLFSLKDKKIPLKLPDEEETLPKLSKEDFKNIDSMLHVQWLIVNGNCVKIDSNENQNNRNDSDDLMNSDQEIETDFVISYLNDDYNKFYEMITSIVLLQCSSEEDDEEMFEVVLNSLRTNSKIHPMLSHLINFLSQTIQKLTCISMNKTSLASKINIFYLQRCINVLKHLIMNKNVFLAPKGFFSKIISCLLFCILQNSSMVSNQDGLNFRDSSANLLVLFMKAYQRYSIGTINYIAENFLKPSFHETIDKKSHLFSLYGVVCLLKHFGGQLIDEFFEMLVKLVLKLEQSDQKNLVIKAEVISVCLKCFVVYFKWLVKSSKLQEPTSWSQKIFSVYNQIYELYGDSFTHQIKLKNRLNYSVEDIPKTMTFKLRELSSHQSSTQLIVHNKGDWFENSYQIKKFESIKINYGKKIVRSPSKSKIEIDEALRQTSVSRKNIVLIRKRFHSTDEWGPSMNSNLNL